MSAFRGFVLAASTLAVGAACYDLDVLRGGARPQPDGGTEPPSPPPSPPPRGSDAGFCERAEDAIFCEDFDSPDADLADRWISVDGGVTGVVVEGWASVSREDPVLRPLSPPRALALELETRDGGRAAVVLTREGLAPAAEAVELSAAFRFSTLTALTDAGAPVPKLPTSSPLGSVDAPRLAVLSLGVPGVDRQGITLELAPESLEMRTGMATSSLDAGAGLRVRVADFDFGSVMNATWLRFHAAIGARDVVLARATAATGGAPTCPEGPVVAVAWSALPLGRSACVVLGQDLLPLAGRPLAVVLGGALRTPSRVRGGVDDLVLRPIR